MLLRIWPQRNTDAGSESEHAKVLNYVAVHKQKLAPSLCVNCTKTNSAPENIEHTHKQKLPACFIKFFSPFTTA